MSCLGSPRRPACWILILILIFISLLVISTPGVGQFSGKATTLNFGNVPVGNSLIQPLTVTNYGKASLTLYQVTVSGSGFRFVGSNLPITLASQETVNLSISFSPPSAASFTGSVTVSAYNSWGNSKNYRYHTATFTLSGTGSSTTPGYLTAPSSLDLGTVMIGHSQTQPLALSNTGASTLTISAVHLTGTGYSVSGLALPYTLAPGASANLSVLFAPTTTGTVTATVNVALLSALAVWLCGCVPMNGGKVRPKK